MHKTKSGYRHRQFDIGRGSYTGTSDDSLSGWYVDRSDSDTLDRRGPGFSTLREAVESIDLAITVEVFSACEADHDLSACSEQQWDRARRGDL